MHVERNLCWRSNPMLRLPLPAASSESSRLPCDCRRSWPTSCAVAWPLSSYRNDFPENYKRTWAICCTRRSIKVMPRRRGPAETNRDPARLYTHAHTVLVSARRTKKPRRSGAKLVLIRRSPTEPLCAVGNPPIEYHIRLPNVLNTKKPRRSGCPHYAGFGNRLQTRRPSFAHNPHTELRLVLATQLEGLLPLIWSCSELFNLILDHLCGRTLAERAHRRD